ncbi:hypothetical protein WJX77_006968 [Trebouxia sp. C0004]
MATHKRSPKAEQGAYRQHDARHEQSQQLVWDSASRWNHRTGSGQADLQRLQSVRSALEARDDLEHGCWVKADHFVQGLRKEYDSRHRHSRRPPRQDASHAESMLPSPDHDRQSSSTDTGPAMQHHVSGHAQVLQHSQVGDHRHHQLAERPDHAHDADHRSLLNMAASGQLFTASNTVWQGSRKASEEAIRPPARRYQRCLQEELGQLLNSQLSNGQPGRQLSGQAGHPDRQLQRLDGQHTPISGQAAHPHEGPQPGHAQRSTAASWQQADQAFATQLSNPVQPPHSLQHTAADSVTGNREPCSQAASDSAYLTKLGSRHAGAQLTDPKPQAYGSQHRRQLKSSEIFSQPKAMLQSQSEAKSVQSNASVHQASSQDCIISAAGQTAVKPTQLCHQQPGGRPETVTHHAKETKADFDGLRGNTEGQVAAVSRRRASGIRLDEDLIQLKRVFPGSRGSSPRRRHLLLHNRLAPFDSNSSSSEDEEPSTPVARPLDSPLPTLSGQKSHLGGEASDSAAPQMSQASDESQAAGGDCPAIGQSAMHVLMLESEKTELSTQLSAAQRCMPTTESTASVADADKIDIPPPNQKLNQVAKMLERLAASDDKSKQLQRQLSELQSSARHKHEQLLVFTDKAQQLQEQLRAADDNAKRLLEQLGLAQARAAAAQLSGSALASDLASAHTAVALKLERLVQAQSQIAQLQQQLQAAQDAAQQSKLSLKFELDSTRTQHAATQHELAYVQQQLQAARHQAQTHMQTEADLKKSLGAAECSAADKGGKLAQSNAEIAALVSQLQDDHREACQAREDARQCESGLRAELLSVHTQLANHQSRANSWQQQAQDTDQRAEQAELQLVVQSQAMAELQKQLLTAQDTQQQAEDVRHEVVQAQAELVTKQASLVKAEAAAEALQQSLQDTQQAAAQTHDSAQQSESALRAELQAAHAQQAAAQVGIMQARGQITVLQERLDITSQKLTKQLERLDDANQKLSQQLVTSQQAESALRAEATAAQQEQAAMHEHHSVLQGQVQTARQNLSKQEQAAHQVESSLKLELESAQLAESDLAVRLQASQQQQLTASAEVTALQQQLQTARGDLTEQTTRVQQAEADLQREPSAFKQTQQLQSAQEEVSLQLRLAQEAEYVSQAASQHAEAELQLSAKSSKHLQVQVEQLEQQLHHAIGSSQHLEQHVSQLQQQLQVARADAAELQQHDDVHQAQLYATRSTIAQLQAKFIDTQAQLAAADAQTDELQAQLATIQLRCSESQRQLANAVEQTAASGETHAQLVAEAAQSRQQLANISAQLAASRLRCSDLESGMTLHQMAAGESSVAPAAPVFSHHCSRRSSSTDQQAGGQEEEEEGAVGAIVDKLWKDLQIERAARQLAEERLQAVEAAAISHQESLLSMHSDSALLYQEVDQFKSVTQLRDDLSAEALAVELRQSLTESKLEPAVTQGSLPAQQPAEVMPHGSTLQRTNPLFSQQEGTGSEALLMQMPVTVHDSGGADMTHQVMPAQAANPCQSAASETSDEDSDPSAAELADSAQNSDPKAAELADPAQNSASSASTEQQQEQVDALHSQLRAKASELQTAEAATEYVQQLLNAVSAENRDLRKQLDQKRILKRSVSELQRSSSSLAFANIQGLSAEHVSKGVALGLQPGRSQISAMWASSPSVRRSLLPEYGSSEPYVRPEQALEGAESLMGLPGSDSMLAEFHSDSMSGLSWPQQSDSGHIESLSQIALKRLSQQGAESSSPSVSGIQQIHTRTPASRGGTPETALMRIGSMDPSSGAFGAALAAAERTSITPKHKISRNISQEEGSVWSGVSPSKASWTTLLKWGSRQLPFGKRESDPEIQPDQSEQITELLKIIEHQSNHLEQYRAVLDTQRESNITLNADCERIQARLDLLGRRSRRTTSSDG